MKNIRKTQSNKKLTKEIKRGPKCKNHDVCGSIGHNKKKGTGHSSVHNCPFIGLKDATTFNKSSTDSKKRKHHSKNTNNKIKKSIKKLKKSLSKEKINLNKSLSSNSIKSISSKANTETSNNSQSSTETNEKNFNTASSINQFPQESSSHDNNLIINQDESTNENKLIGPSPVSDESEDGNINSKNLETSNSLQTDKKVEAKKRGPKCQNHDVCGSIGHNRKKNTGHSSVKNCPLIKNSGEITLNETDSKKRKSQTKTTNNKIKKSLTKDTIYLNKSVSLNEVIKY